VVDSCYKQRETSGNPTSEALKYFESSIESLQSLHSVNLPMHAGENVGRRLRILAIS
jgi:hypothetical protein